MNIESRIEHGTCFVTFHGRLTFVDNPEFRTVLDSINNERVATIRLDMSQLEFIDSSGLGMLLLAHDASTEHNKKLLLVGVQGQVRRIFDLAQFGKFFDYAG